MALDSYAYAKLSELVEELFADTRDARKKLVERQATFFVIAAADFSFAEDQQAWKQVQNVMSKVRNFGSERIPDERLTVRNATIKSTLRTIWTLWLRANEAQTQR
jgi:hypothetical protein